MKILLVFISIFIFNCTVPEGESVSEVADKNYTIKVIDSCEYIECDYGIFDQRVYSLTHKGNCKYCLVRNNKLLKDAKGKR